MHPTEEAMPKTMPFQRKRWGVALCLLLVAMLMGYISHNVSQRSNNVAQVAKTPEQARYAEEALRIMEKRRRSSKGAIKLDAIIARPGTKEERRQQEDCAGMPQEEFNRRYDSLYKFDYYGYSNNNPLGFWDSLIEIDSNDTMTSYTVSGCELFAL